MMAERFPVTLLVLCLTVCGVSADHFEYLDADRQSQSLDGQIFASDETITVIQQDDGGLLTVPSSLITRREPADGPAFISSQQTLERLQEKYGTELFRGTTSGPFVVGVILQAPVVPKNERKLTGALRKSAAYMVSIEKSFDRFMKSVGVETTAAQAPLVLLIFESDDDFEAFSDDRLELSSRSRVNGFYSQTTNRLYVRMSECASFETPLHEAVHQLCFNKGVFQRLAPVPGWLAEGMACSFSGNGKRSTGKPSRLNTGYAVHIARQYRSGRSPSSFTDWNRLVSSDDAFRGQDPFNAYIRAWGLHWTLVLEQKKNYGEYLQYVQTLTPLSEVSGETRMQEFRRAFSVAPGELEEPFAGNLTEASKQTREVVNALRSSGFSEQDAALGRVSVEVTSEAGSIHARGSLRNISPFRDMAYYVAVVSGDTSLRWFIPEVRMNKSVPLKSQQVPGGNGRYTVLVKSTPVDSDVAAEWAAGRFPPHSR